MFVKNFTLSKRWIYHNARPIDIARWKYHFESGSFEDVLKVLETYQNDDGGFGHALEPDIWNPNSSPLTTWVAINYLQELEIDPKHPIIQKIIKYLTSGVCFESGFWKTIIPSNNDYPHAPWWNYEAGKDCWNYNPTAALSGFVVAYGNHDIKDYHRYETIVKNAIQYFLENDVNEMHEARCFVDMFNLLKKANRFDLLKDGFITKLKTVIYNTITRDTNLWQSGYVCLPSRYFNSPKSEFYEENAEMANYEIEFIQKSQNHDGTWSVNWSWSDYLNDWQIAKSWWKASLIIEKLIYIKNFKGIQDHDN